MPPSPSSSSSRPNKSPEPQPPPKKRSKKSKDKGKKKATDQIESKNEGIDKNWAYKPPAGRVLVEDNEDAGEFDWDVINGNEDLDLWVIRVPESIKPKYFDGLQIELPPSSKSAKIGSMTRKHATFDVWSLGDDDDNQPVAGEEIKSLSCLLPRKSKKGKLYAAPRPIAHHLVLAAQAVKCSADSTSPLEKDSITGKYKNPPRHSYPAELLNHRFQPYGSLTDVDMDASVPMEVDVAPPPTEQPTETVAEGIAVEKESKKSKGKKRKGETQQEGPDLPAPKKSKKSKAMS